MLSKRFALIPFALSALFISTTNIALADEGYLTIDQILSQADSFNKAGGNSSKREIQKPSDGSGGVAGLSNISRSGGLVGQTSRAVDKSNVGGGQIRETANSNSGTSANKSSGTVSGVEESEGVDSIPLVRYNAEKVKNFNGYIVGYRDGVPIMCPNPEPEDIHPDVDYNDGPHPTISVPIKYRNFDLTLSAFNKTMIEDVEVHRKNFIVSYPYEADAFNDREEVIALHNEIKSKRAFGYRSIESMKDVLTLEEIDAFSEEQERVGELKDFDLGIGYIVQILEVDDENKRIKFRIDYNQRNQVSKYTEKLSIDDTEFKYIELPVIEEKSIARIFWLPIKKREEVVVRIDSGDFIKIKFNEFKYDAVRVEIDDLDKLAIIEEENRRLEQEAREAEAQAIMDEKLRYFDEIEEAINNL